MAKRFLTIPNLISLYRLLLALVVPALWMAEFSREFLIILILTGVISDTLDGNLARVLGQRSDLGKILDPLADKAFINMLFFLLYIEGAVTSTLLTVVFGRDLFILLGSIYLMKKGFDSRNFSPTPLGKISTVIQLITLVILFTDFYIKDLPVDFTTAFQYLTIFFTSASGFQYFLLFLRYNSSSSLQKKAISK